MDQHGNFGYGTVLTAPSPASSGISLTLNSGQGADFPDPASGQYNIIIWPSDALPLNSNTEIVRVTAKAGDVLTITRTQESTSARTVVAGDRVGLAATKKVFTDIESGITDRALTGFTTTTVAGAVVAGTHDSLGMKLAVPGFLTTAMASNRASDFAAASAVFNGTNASGTMASNSWSVSVAAQTNQSVGVYASSNSTLTSSGTLDARSFSVKFMGSISGGFSGSALLVSAPNALTTAALSGDTTKYVQEYVLLGANTAGTTSTAPGTRVNLSGGNNVTLSMNSNTLIISVPNTVAQSVQSMGLYASSNTTLTTSGTADARSLSFRGIGAASFGVSASEVILSVPVQTNQSVGLYGSSNTTLTSSGTADARSLSFRGVGGVSIGVSASELLVSAPATSSLVGTGGVLISSNGATISVSLSAMNAFEPMALMNGLSTTFAPTIGGWYFAPAAMPFPISGGRMNMMIAHGSTASVLRESSVDYQTGSTGTGSTDFTYGRAIALYQLDTGTNSTRLTRVWSGQNTLSIARSIKVASAAGPNMTVSVGATMSYLASIDSAGGTTTTTYGASSTTAGAVSSIGTTNMTSVASSLRNMLSSQLMFPIPVATTLNAGQYYVAMQFSTGSTTLGTGNLTSTADLMSIVNQYGLFGNTNTAARNWGATVATSGSAPFMGVGSFSAASASPPATMAFSDIRTFASQVHPYWNYHNSTI